MRLNTQLGASFAAPLSRLRSVASLLAWRSRRDIFEISLNLNPVTAAPYPRGSSFFWLLSYEFITYCCSFSSWVEAARHFWGDGQFVLLLES